TLCTLSVRPRAPTPQMGPYHRSRKLGGGLRPPSDPPTRNRLRRRSRRSNRNVHRWRYFSWPCGVYSDSLLARREADADGGGTAALPAQAVVVGDELDVVGPLQSRVRHAEEIEQRLGVADHAVPRLARVPVLLAAEQP